MYLSPLSMARRRASILSAMSIRPTMHGGVGTKPRWSRAGRRSISPERLCDAAGIEKGLSLRSRLAEAARFENAQALQVRVGLGLPGQNLGVSAVSGEPERAVGCILSRSWSQAFRRPKSASSVDPDP